MESPAIVESVDVSSQQSASSGIEDFDFDFEAHMKMEGITTEDTSIGTKNMPTELEMLIANNQRLMASDGDTECGGEEVRSASEAHGYGDSDMRDKLPDRPAYFPLSVAAANDQDISEPRDIGKLALCTAPEDDQVPMTVDEPYPPANGMEEQVSDQEQSTSVDAGGPPAAATDPQIASSMDAAVAGRPNEEGGNGHLSPPESDADQGPPQPKLVDEIIKAVASAERVGLPT